MTKPWQIVSTHLYFLDWLTSFLSWWNCTLDSSCLLVTKSVSLFWPSLHLCIQPFCTQLDSCNVLLPFSCARILSKIFSAHLLSGGDATSDLWLQRSSPWWWLVDSDPSPPQWLCSGCTFSANCPTCGVGQHSNAVCLKLDTLPFFSHPLLSPWPLALAKASPSFCHPGLTLRVNRSLTGIIFIFGMSFGFIHAEPAAGLGYRSPSLQFLPLLI